MNSGVEWEATKPDGKAVNVLHAREWGMVGSRSTAPVGKEYCRLQVLAPSAQ